MNREARLQVRFGDFEGVLEDVKCPLCSPAPSPHRIFKMKEGIEIFECPKCKLQYASPRFDEASLRLIYENEAFFDKSKYDNWSYYEWKSRAGRDWIVPNLKVALVNRFVSGESRVLDVGCGTGEFVYLANRHGLKCEGIDISHMLTDIARDRLKVPVHCERLEAFHPEHRFHAIVIWDVLEHVHDPVMILKECNRLLNAGGFLICQVPNSRGVSTVFKTISCRTGIKKNNYAHFGFPWHLYSFNKHSLLTLLVAAGFDALHFESWSHHHKDGNTGPIPRIVKTVVRRCLLSDYIIAVAQKTVDAPAQNSS